MDLIFHMNVHEYYRLINTVYQYTKKGPRPSTAWDPLSCILTSNGKSRLFLSGSLCLMSGNELLLDVVRHELVARELRGEAGATAGQ